MKVLQKIFFFSVLCLLFITSSFSANIFVSTAGKDAHEGTFDKPVKTLQKAADLSSPGDTVFVMSGYYHQKMLIKDKKGNQANPIVFKALGHVIIDGPPGLSLEGVDLQIGDFDLPLSSRDHLYYPYFRGAVIRIENSSHIVIDGFEIADSEWFGLAGLYSDHLTIQHCIIHDLQASGIYLLYCKDLTVAFNEIMRACAWPRRLHEHGSQECISIVNSTEFEIMYNRIHETKNWNYVQYQASAVGGEGIDVKEHSKNGSVHHNYVYNLMRPGLYVDAWDSKDTRNVSLYNNVVHNTQNGVALGCENLGELNNILIYNNLLYNNWLEGIILAAWAKGGAKKGIRIFNNTIYNNWEGGINLGSEIHEDIYVYNNIMYQNTRLRDLELRKGEAQKLKISHNLVTEKPLFVEGGNHEYMLQEESPAIDAGMEVPDFVKNDLNDAPRIAGDKVDIGAFEYGSEPTGPRIMYVSRSGSNHFPGTFYLPYQTINKAIKSAVAGDKIIILPGFYNENINCENIQGAEIQKIIIRGHGDVVINNPEESEDALVILKSCQFIEFENMTFNANDKTGISVMGSSNISIKNCRIEGFVKTAIRVQGTKDSHFSYNEIITGKSLKTQKQPGIQVDNNESSVVFENNWFRTYL